MGRYAPENKTIGRNDFKRNLPPGATLGDLLKDLAVPANLIKIRLVNGRHAATELLLADGDQITFFPPMS
jgi:molybdopterin converting factor small subunit